MTEIFVEIRGGVLVESYSNDPDLRVNVIDWDHISEDPEHIGAETIACLPLGHMPTETLEAFARFPRNN